jgi:hypothetical protein
MLRRQIAIVCGLAALAAGGQMAQPVAAAPPEEFTLTGTTIATDLTSCAFPVVMELDYRIVRRDYLDRAGQLKHRIIHVQLVGTDSANGISLDESDHYTIHVSADETERLTGLTMHARLPGGGLVTRDAGSFVRAPDGSIDLVRGPHPALLGDTEAYCRAFG